MGEMNGHPRGAMVEPQTHDLVVGRLIDSGLQAQVSVRGGRVVVLGLARSDGRGTEVAFSPRAARQIAEMVEAAAKVAEGGGR